MDNLAKSFFILGKRICIDWSLFSSSCNYVFCHLCNHFDISLKVGGMVDSLRNVVVRWIKRELQHQPQNSQGKSRTTCFGLLLNSVQGKHLITITEFAFALISVYI